MELCQSKARDSYQSYQANNANMKRPPAWSSMVIQFQVVVAWLFWLSLHSWNKKRAYGIMRIKPLFIALLKNTPINRRAIHAVHLKRI